MHTVTLRKSFVDVMMNPCVHKHIWVIDSVALFKVVGVGGWVDGWESSKPLAYIVFSVGTQI